MKGKTNLDGKSGAERWGLLEVVDHCSTTMAVTQGTSTDSYNTLGWKGP